MGYGVIGDCPKCGGKGIEERATGPHLGLYCRICGVWLRWLPKPIKEPDQFVMPFGKHAGKPMIDLPLEYVQWGAANLKGSVQRHMRAFLDEL